MKQRTKALALALMALLSTACEDVIDVDTGPGIERLVIEGQIDDVPGQVYTVKISRTTPFSSTTPNPKVPGASVTVKDTKGGIFVFTEKEPGIYRSSGFTGKAGETYQLFVALADGKKYQSKPELLAPVAPIDSLYARFEPKELFGNKPGYIISIDFQDPPEKGNFYRWDFFDGDSSVIPPRRFFSTDDVFFNGNYIDNFEFRGHTYQKGDTATVKQMSLSEGVYVFNNGVQTQSNTGSLFDPPPAPIYGNIYNTAKPDEYALGYFSASAVVTKSIVFPK